MKSILIAILLALTAFACSSQPEEHTSVTAEALTQHVYENGAVGSTCPTTPRSCKLYESAGPNPPSSPQLVLTSVVGGGSSTTGTYNTLTSTANLSVQDATYDFLRAEINGLSATQYMRVDIYYDDIGCNPTTHLCPIDGPSTTATVENL